MSPSGIDFQSGVILTVPIGRADLKGEMLEGSVHPNWLGRRVGAIEDTSPETASLGRLLGERQTERDKHIWQERPQTSGLNTTYVAHPCQFLAKSDGLPSSGGPVHVGRQGENMNSLTPNRSHQDSYTVHMVHTSSI
ncbi:hypothetical protein C8F01DRAFT_1236102 [Mycena amicta]|nr:hypothetical protein C8F01DRAFT_1236102 [Mycena amicta]